MRNKTYQQLCRYLATKYSHTEFQLTTTGTYDKLDSDWNYKDIPHLNIIHSQVDSLFTFTDDRIVTSVNFQKVLGFELPMVVVNYESSAFDQVYYTTFGPFILCVNTVSEEGESSSECITTTTYTVFSARLLKPLHWLLRRLITKNYKILMSEDRPMREQRGSLRRLGYTFKRNGSETYGFEETLNISENRVAPTAGISMKLTLEKSVLRHLAATNETIGEGLLKFIPQETEVGLALYPGTCPHEGAEICHSHIDNITGKAICPWHGRRLTPLLSLTPTGDTTIIKQPGYRVKDFGATIEVELVDFAGS